MCVVKQCSSIEEMLKEEARLIALWNPAYNILKEGNLFSYVSKKPIGHMKGKIPWNKNKSHSVATKKKLSAYFTGKPATRTEKALAYWEKFGERMAASKRKEIICENDGKIFSCAREAAAFYGIRREDIRKACAGISKQTHGFTFRYLNGN